MMAGYDERPRRRSPIGLEWQERASCRGLDPGPWCSTRRAEIARAVVVCMGCPVRLRCLQYALDGEAQTMVPEPLVFGGMTPAERMAVLSRRRR